MNYHLERTISGSGSDSAQFAAALRGLALGANDQLYTVGDSAVKVLAPSGELLRQWRTERPGFSVAIADNNAIYVGETGQVEIFDAEGNPLKTWRDPERLEIVTAIGFLNDEVLLGDVGGRCIRRFNRQGEYLGDIGNQGRMRGFLIPNRHVDFAIDDSGTIHAANPGKHRVERYSRAGELLGHFGRFDGQDPAGFTGCCNPTNITLTARGDIVVTEKAGPRVKVYDAKGKLLAVFGEKDFDPNCKNMDVAADSQGRIYVIDTVRRQILVFAPETASPTTQPAAAGRGGTVKP